MSLADTPLADVPLASESEAAAPPPAGPDVVPETLHKIEDQHAPITAASLGGVLVE